MTISHEFFGELDLEGVENNEIVWEQAIELNQQTTAVELWANNETHLTQEKLNKFASFVHKLADFDKIARVKLISYLTADSFYITHHIEEMRATKVMQTLGDSPSVQDFFKAMQLEYVNLWQKSDLGDDKVIFDYIIDKENTSYVLAVEFDIDGNFQEISFDS